MADASLMKLYPFLVKISTNFVSIFIYQSQSDLTYCSESWIFRLPRKAKLKSRVTPCPLIPSPSAVGPARDYEWPGMFCTCEFSFIFGINVGFS